MLLGELFSIPARAVEPLKGGVRIKRKMGLRIFGAGTAG
jgi:hypothetical protein